jgi:hypothetical protein
MIRNILTYIIIILNSGFSFGQVNFIPNGSFEQYTHCPDYVGQIDSCLYWMSPSTYSPGADYLNRCTNNINPYYGVPSNVWGYQEAQNGDGYCLIGLYGYPNFSNYREYIETPLVVALTQNKCYHISFFISLPEAMKYSCNDIGCYFSDTIVRNVQNYYPLPFTPQFKHIGSSLTDVIDWVLIDGDILASGGEKYLMIGNFDDDSLSSEYLINNTATIISPGIYIDDVSLIETDLSAIIPHDTIVHLGDSIYIGGQTGIGLDNDCIWYADGVPIDTVAGIWVKPDTTTTYVLQQDICGIIHYDTINVIVSGIGLEQYDLQKHQLSAYPNPTKDEFTIEYNGNINNEEIVVEIYNIYGAQTKIIDAGKQIKTAISTKDIPAGIYYYSVKLGNKIVGKDKIVIIK